MAGGARDRLVGRRRAACDGRGGWVYRARRDRSVAQVAFASWRNDRLQPEAGWRVTDLSSFRGSDPRPEPSVGGIGRPKRKTPTRALPAEIEQLRAAKARECRLCGVTASEAQINLAHLVARGMGGTIGGEWVAANLVGLCGHGNLDGCHGLVDGYDPEARRALRAKLHSDEVEYIVAKMGQGWLDRFYPEAVPA
jgi:hypothetical protein